MLSRQRLLSVAALLLACLLVGRLAYAKEAIIPSLAGEPYDSGWSLQMDNDLLTPKNHDRDYTGGIALSFAGKRVQQWPISLDSTLQNFNRWLKLTDVDNRPTLHSMQVGIAAFAPQDLKRDDVNVDDRPYASLVYLTNSRQSLENSGRTAIQSTLTVGILGTHIAKVLQKEIHKFSKSDSPQGWKHQIANGGEPTLRYTYASEHLLINSDDRLRFEVKYSNEGSLGFLTEVNSSISARWGLIKTPWWSFAPDRAEYFAQPSAGLLKASRRGASEFYIWTGAKIRARAYNAFLQGQFRESELRYDWQEVRPVLAEAWLGITKQVTPHTRLSWIMRYQSSELRGGNGDRDLVWGSVLLNRDF
ncbi:MAG: lipid A deacylase LpxR family protein [Moraxellaceae bacterium]|nr:lipid A deacylase LpxR family protein [Moraxellaceae bacterium]